MSLMFFLCFFFPSALDISSFVHMDYSCCVFIWVHFQKIFLHFWVISRFVTVITLWSIFHRKVPHCWHAASYTSKWSEPQKRGFGPLKRSKDTGYPFVENPMVWKMIQNCPSSSHEFVHFFKSQRWLPPL